MFKYIYIRIYVSCSETSWHKHRFGLTEVLFQCVITVIIWKP